MITDISFGKIFVNKVKGDFQRLKGSTLTDLVTLTVELLPPSGLEAFLFSRTIANVHCSST